jgi:hypothetical protein
VIGFYFAASENTYLEVFQAGESKDGGQSGNLSHFCLETDSVEATRKRLADFGYQPGPIKTGVDQSHQFWINDPNGIAMEFHEYTAQSSQKTGKDVEVDW